MQAVSMWRLMLLCSPTFAPALGAKDTTFTAQLSPVHTYMLNARKQTSVHPQAMLKQTRFRPNAGREADKVYFGLLAKNYFGSNLKKHTFKIDFVMSLRWVDRRVTHLIPARLDKLSMSTEEASKKLWMPAITVSNRDIDQYEIVSSAVTIYRSGEVHRVERAKVKVCELFELDQYPFDTQHFRVKIASSKYMLNDVVLVPNMNASGVEEDIWGGYSLQDWSLSAFEEADGELVKSRGEVDYTVHRTLEKYAQDHLIPLFIVLTISWAVFYFPFAGPFITPRLVLSILALLQFTRLMIKSARPLPGAAPFNWNDLLNQQVQILVFSTVVINIISEICFHTFKMDKRARAINNEAKVLLPCLSIFNVVLILSAAQYKWLSLPHTTAISQIVSITALGAYATQIFYDVHKELKAAEQQGIDDKP